MKSSSEGGEDSVGDEGELAQISQISSVKAPQKKDFVREEVKELVMEHAMKRSGTLGAPRAKSLAVERLIRQTEGFKNLQQEQRPF